MSWQHLKIETVKNKRRIPLLCSMCNKAMYYGVYYLSGKEYCCNCINEALEDSIELEEIKEKNTNKIL